MLASLVERRRSTKLWYGSKARCTSMVLNSVPVEMYRFAYIIDDD